MSVVLLNRAEWFDYAALFDTAWAITVRYVAGWLFVSVFWVVIFLSNALLELVDIDVIEALYEVEWVRFALSGAMLGLGLAVAFELREYVSPVLVLRLLRLLLPIVLTVVAVFIAVLPLRGLSQLFGDFSAAGTLMGVAIASISLISIALDRDDRYGIRTPGMLVAARALAVLVPILSGLAAWAVILRVQQYGWTPQRVLAATIATVLMIYGLSYLWAALHRRGWRGALRQGNFRMALLALAVAALWLTPVLNAERISAQSQLARFDSGVLPADQLPLWELSHDWGYAGTAVLEVLRAQADGLPDLAQRLAALEQADSRFAFEQSLGTQKARRGLDDLVPLIAVRPEGAVDLDVEMFSELEAYLITQWQEGCARADNGQPRCVWIVGAFLPGIPAEDQAIFLFTAENQVRASHVVLDRGQISDRVRAIFDVDTGAWAELPDDAISRVIAGQFAIVPSGIAALEIDGVTLVPGN